MPARTVRPARRAFAGAVALALALTALAGCGSAGDTSAAEPAADQPAAAVTAEPSKVVTVSVQDGKVVPEPTTVTVKTGDVVRIDATSDQEDTVHVHGIDAELSLDPDVPGQLTFVAKPSGSYEVETHESGLLLFRLDVTD
ncbi:cupredoxin domain-containing protein [Motilibacter aurantiacus]|uniref:hypothetical protein n=1 Tax=Motilibacter aurantiacus TaxID=2714955 RepID=UPI001407BF0F|nr:hypothetical protein [Motilibacter aurantiacus]NHC45810.1 hypothetical protein [Motilibacter aurantiacus]